MGSLRGSKELENAKRDDVTVWELGTRNVDKKGHGLKTGEIKPLTWGVKTRK